VIQRKITLEPPAFPPRENSVAFQSTLDGTLWARGLAWCNFSWGRVKSEYHLDTYGLSQWFPNLFEPLPKSRQRLCLVTRNISQWSLII